VKNRHLLNQQSVDNPWVDRLYAVEHERDLAEIVRYQCTNFLAGSRLAQLDCLVQENST
jgi:hypothetical protein